MSVQCQVLWVRRLRPCCTIGEGRWLRGVIDPQPNPTSPSAAAHGVLNRPASEDFPGVYFVYAVWCAVENEASPHRIEQVRSTHDPPVRDIYFVIGTPS